MISGSHSYRPRWIEMSWETDSTYPSQTLTREPTKTVCCALLSFQLRFAFRHLYSFHITIKRSAGGSVGMAPPSRSILLIKILWASDVDRVLLRGYVGDPPRLLWEAARCVKRVHVMRSLAISQPTTIIQPRRGQGCNCVLQSTVKLLHTDSIVYALHRTRLKPHPR